MLQTELCVSQKRNDTTKTEYNAVDTILCLTLTLWYYIDTLQCCSIHLGRQLGQEVTKQCACYDICKFILPQPLPRNRRQTTTFPLLYPKSARAHTHTQKYIMLIPLPLQQWFHDRVSVLRCTYIACLVYYSIIVNTFHYPAFWWTPEYTSWPETHSLLFISGIESLSAVTDTVMAYRFRTNSSFKLLYSVKTATRDG
jgi:hypothetical protein